MYHRFVPTRAFVIIPVIAAFLLIAIASCQKESEKRFEILSSEHTQIHFSNNLRNTFDFNILNYLYFYDGGGVSIGDINNDGLPDIYFTANMLPNTLYLNRGNFRFEDITEKAGVGGTSDWTTGTTMADINGDGLLDIYVSGVNYLNKNSHNQLFINNGDSTFTEKASEYGLDFEGYAKQASFFDYDNDGDLDMYLLNHAVHTEQSFTNAEIRESFSADAGDKLFRNEGGQFVDVTEESGIYSSVIGYGLAAAVSDLNKDGCQDIYVSNDFHENDYLYLNNCDGTFREVIEQSTGHTSRASMGTDIADINNDGLLDIFVLDMLPYDEQTRKKAVSSESYDIYQVQRRFGYHPQLIRNTLQLNMGIDGEGIPLFAEIGRLAGVEATDWSWASLIFDMNSDGKKDLFVSNGIFRRPNDMDYLLTIRSQEVQQVMQRGMSDTAMSLIQNMPKVKIPNIGFINEGDYQFAKNPELGFGYPSYSNGAAYGDLDNDGDLDLVVNNVNMKAHIYRNQTIDRNNERGEEAPNYLKLRLHGEASNTYGIGGKIGVFTDGVDQHFEVMTSRGFLSSVEPLIVAGVGSSTLIDSVKVTWPDGRIQTLKEVSVNQTLDVHQEDATKDSQDPALKEPSPIFNTTFNAQNSLYQHEENNFNDYDAEPLLPYKLSAQGPALSTADVNGDGLDDFYIGGAKYQSGALFIQNDEGSFDRHKVPVFEQDQLFEDVGAAFFDANNDGFPDLYVVTGGSEYAEGANAYLDRLYVNDGSGNFERAANSIPAVRTNGSVVVPADINGDGAMDLFVGGRSVAGNYGRIPDSIILQNSGNGQFREVTGQVAEGLKKIGMVTDAIWKDIDGNGEADLIVVGEWMPITVFMNEQGTLVNYTESLGLSETHGWWSTVAGDDFDGDGDIDFIVGNHGKNSMLKPSKSEPLKLYVEDLNGDTQVDPVLSRTVGNKEYPIAPRDELFSHLNYLGSRYRSYDDFAGQTVSQIFEDRITESSEIRKATMMSSSYLENKGEGGFEIHDLPIQIQFAPVMAITIGDFNNDGHIDALLGGNLDDVKPSYGGRIDGSYGWYLKGNGNGGFTVTNPFESGFVVNGEIRDIALLNEQTNLWQIVVARNDDDLLIFEHVPSKSNR